MSRPLPRAVLAMSADLPDRLLSPAARARLDAAYRVDFGTGPATTRERLLQGDNSDVEVIITGWGAPRIDAPVLDQMPSLRGIHHAAGSVKGHVSLECWDRGVRVTSAADANSQPVAEYAASMIVLAAKEVFRSQVLYRERRSAIDREVEFPRAGTNGGRIGLIGASRIGRRVLDLLTALDLDISVHDPFLDQDEAQRLGVTSKSLDELLATSDVVSVHAPLLDETHHLLDHRRLALLADGATLINTARGAVVDPDALERELVSGRLWAILDVTDPLEPLPRNSPLFDLPNVILTPHVAGAMGNELLRLGDHAVDQAVRLRHGVPLDGEVLRRHLETMA